MKSHRPKKPHRCTRCSKKFTKKSELNLHMKRHKPKLLNPFLCNICGKAFVSLKILQRHIMRMHRRCPVCPKRYKGLSSLSKHLKNHYREDGTLDPDSILSIEAVTKPCRCLFCKYRCVTQKGLMNHMRKSHGISFSCSECEKSFTSEGSLLIHLRCHEIQNPIKCSFCESKFPSLLSLLTHMTKCETRPRPFVCSVCERCFPHEGHLKRHMKTHIEERPFGCSVCGKTFVTQRNLTKHQEICHRICPLCPRRLPDKARLTEHLRSHSQARFLEYLKPFSCSVCGWRSQSESDLKKHMVVHAE